MKTNYITGFLGMAALLSLSIVSCAQDSKMKTKTITIINGDTTISESDGPDGKEINKMMKDINVTISADGDSTKKIVKKIVIRGENADDAKAMAYAYSTGDGDDQDIEVNTDEHGGETKIIIKKKDDKGDKRDKGEKGDKGDKGEKKVITKTIRVTDGKEEKEHMNLNINVKNTTAKIEIETGSKSPLNISVLDENGKQVFYDTQKDGSKYSKEIPLGKKGTYFLNLIQDKKSTSEKIVVD
ncbi:MAG: T9SS type A sorting domain-containing protein [Bacteroidia bacterium]